jgi:hypothetical protein
MPDSIWRCFPWELHIMAADTVVIQGIVKAGGMLELASPVTLPPGPVEVTVRAVAPTRGEDLLTLLARIRTEQEGSGYIPRTREEIDADMRNMRDEWEEHQMAIEKFQEECRRQRDAAALTEPTV